MDIHLTTHYLNGGNSLRGLITFSLPSTTPTRSIWWISLAARLRQKMSTLASESSEATSFLDTTVSSVRFIRVSVTRAAAWSMQATFCTSGIAGSIESSFRRSIFIPKDDRLPSSPTPLFFSIDSL